MTENVDQLFPEIQPDATPQTTEKTKRGRKPRLDGGRVVSVWLDDETIRKIEGLCKMHDKGISVSECVRRLINQQIDGHDAYFDEEGKLFD